MDCKNGYHIVCGTAGCYQVCNDSNDGNNNAPPPPDWQRKCWAEQGGQYLANLGLTHVLNPNDPNRTTDFEVINNRLATYCNLDVCGDKKQCNQSDTAHAWDGMQAKFTCCSLANFKRLWWTNTMHSRMQINPPLARVSGTRCKMKATSTAVGDIQILPGFKK